MTTAAGLSSTDSCPCGGGMFGGCCGPYLSGEAHAPTPEALMRSRYSAYVTKHVDYVRVTWDAAHCPTNLDLDNDVQWVRLIVHESTVAPDGTTGTVRFTAIYRDRGIKHRMVEQSLFHRIDGRWLYLYPVP